MKRYVPIRGIRGIRGSAAQRGSNFSDQNERRQPRFLHSFTELVQTLNCGRVSINISKPGIIKGQHLHHTKFEQFIVVAGHGLIQQRNLNDPEGKVIEWVISGDKIEAVHMLPGYTHNIINLSEKEDLVTVMYCNEIFNPNKPDTFFDPVVHTEQQ